MSTRSLLLLAAGIAAVIASPALSQTPRQGVSSTCAPNYPQRSVLGMIFSAGPAPQANGCAPPVYSGGRFVGQDPDPNIRLQLLRNSDNEGYHLNTR